MDREKFIFFLRTACADFFVHEFLESSNNVNFEASLYCELPGNGFDDKCAKFIDKFSSSTGSDWIAGKRLGNCVRYRFRKVFLCQKSKKNKSKLPADEKPCGAKIDIKWKLINRDTIKNDANLKKLLSCFIMITFEHNHPLKSISIFTYLRSSKNTDELFKSYFRLGLSPSASRIYHEISLAGSSSFNVTHQDLADALSLVNGRHLLYLSDVWKKKEKGPARSHLQDLQAKKSELEEHGHFINLNETTLEMAIITPLMMAVFKEVADEENLSVFIVSCTTSPDLESYHARNLICFFVPSKIGALPIGCVLQKSEDFTQPLALLKDSIETVTGKQFCPYAFYNMDDCLYQQTSIDKVFPSSHVFLSSSSLLLSVWKYLHSPKTWFPYDFKRDVMSRFTNLVQAKTTSEVQEHYDNLCELTSACPLVKDYIILLLPRQKEWCHMYRKENHKDDDCFIPCELSLRIFKEVILLKGKHFTDEAWAEIVCKPLEYYFKKRIVDFASGLDVSSHFSIFSQPILGLGVSRTSEHDFEVTFLDEKLKFPQCKVNFDYVPTCDCEKNGNLGKFCGHLNTILERFIWPSSQPNPSEEAPLFKRLAAVCGGNTRLIHPTFVPETGEGLIPLEQIKVEFVDGFNSDKVTLYDETEIGEETLLHEFSQTQVKSENLLEADVEETPQISYPAEKSPFELVTVSCDPIKQEVVPEPTLDPLASNDQSDPFLSNFKIDAISKINQALLTTFEATDPYNKMTEQKCIVRKIKSEFDRVIKIVDNSLITCRPDLESLYQFHNQLLNIRSTVGAVEFMEDNLRGEEAKRKESEQEIKIEPEVECQRREKIPRLD